MSLLRTSLMMITALAWPLSDDRNEVENPVYSNWKSYEVGTVVRYRQVTTTPTFEERRILEYRLKSKSDTELSVEIRNYVEESGEESANVQNMVARRYFRLPNGVSKAEFGKPAGRKSEGTEKVELLEREYDAKWYVAEVRVEAGTTESRTWSSPEVPGALLKSISKTPAVSSVTTIELIKVDRPKPEVKPQSSP